MKRLVCVGNNVFFNKRIYNYGDHVAFDDALAAKARPEHFISELEFAKQQKVVEEKIIATEKSGRSIREVIKEAEEEKRKLRKKIEILENAKG